jgi:hypothetical protein
MAALYSHTTRSTGTTLTAAIYNADHQNHIDNGIPAQLDDYSSSVSQMQSTTDPGEVGTESQPTSLAGELERLRFAIKEAKAVGGSTPAQWYTTPVAAWSTGDVKVTFKTTADSGWVLMNDGTIGNAASGGTTRANADTVDLFTLLYNNTVDADCAVSGGRGANAAADYAANKTIALPKALGRDLAIYGAGSGLTSRALASVLGAETKTISTTNLPASGLSIPGLSVPGLSVPALTVQGVTGSGGALTGFLHSTDGSVDADQNTSTGTTGTGTTGTGTTGNMGSGTALDIMNPRFHANVMIKL